MYRKPGALAGSKPLEQKRQAGLWLLTGLCVAACRQKRRVRFTTAAGPENELVEAKHKLELRRVMSRSSRYDLIAIDEVGYVPLAEVGAEFLFQVVADRAHIVGI